MDLKKILINSLKIIYIAMILYFMYQVIRAIIGGTWETEDIIVAGMGIIIASLFTIGAFQATQSRCLGRLEERTKHTGQSLNNMGQSLTRLGNDFKTLQNDFKVHKVDFKTLQNDFKMHVHARNDNTYKINHRKHNFNY